MPRHRDENLLRLLGRRVNQVRRDRGWTQERLAEAIGIEPVTLSRQETGDRALSVTTLASIASALEVSLSELLDVDAPLPQPEGDPEVLEVARLVAGLSPSGRDVVLRVARELAKACS